uniref:5-hydroxytryptamine receptor 2C-like n=1 Tax=Styela clava TaxID=7725 RepID=UPI0019397E41|nr:5-hydroxytryptamine receptor 2C-like [Styela clava]
MNDIASVSIHHRVKRFLYSENKTCGHIVFCTEEFHDENYNPSTALINIDQCSAFLTILSLIVDLILTLVITSSNVLIILVIRRSGKLHNCQGIFKTSLAMFDLLVGIFVIPGAAYNKIRFMLIPLDGSFMDVLFRSNEDVINIIFGGALVISLSGSLMSLFLLSLDRYLAISRPFAYNDGKVMTKRVAHSLVVIVLCIAVFLASVPLGDPDNFYYVVDYMTMAFIMEIRFNADKGNIYHGLFFVLIIFVIPYLAIVVVTIITWVVIIRDHSRTNDPGHLPPPSPGENLEWNNLHESSECGDVESTISNEDSNTKKFSIAKAIRKNYKTRRLDDSMHQVTKTVLAIVVVFSLCVLPWIIVEADNLSGSIEEFKNIEIFGHGHTPTPHTCYPAIYMVCLYLMFLNSFCNFIIYNLRNFTFRKEFLKLFGYIKSEDGFQSNNSMSATENESQRKSLGSDSTEIQSSRRSSLSSSRLDMSKRRVSVMTALSMSPTRLTTLHEIPRVEEVECRE